MSDKPRVVVCAAMRNPDGMIITGPRHYDSFMINQIRRLGCHNPALWADYLEQGFIDQFGVFMDRREAHKVATEAGQIKYRVGGDSEELYSENLY